MRIAILDDEPGELSLLRQTLESVGHHVHAYSESKALMAELRRETFDLLILDWQVPDLTGRELLTWLRQNETRRTPVMFVTLRSAEEDIVSALEAGADDYMIKPIRRGELLARVQALLRRSYPQKRASENFEFGEFAFDPATNVVKKQGTPITLTQKEFDLALLLFRNIGRPLSRSHILEIVWGRDIDVPSRTMDTHMSRIRTKLDLRPERGYRLAPVYSYGYRLEQVTP